MRIAVRPVVTTSVALAGAGALAIAPLQHPAPATSRVVEQDVSLAAASLAYVPVNAIEQSASAPANMVLALNRLATALAASGSWNESHPNNVWGWDPANPAMLRESINVLVPYPALSEPVGRHLNWWAAANLPMYAGCAYECADLPGMLNSMFKVPISDFYDEDGYTFPTVVNPVDGQETEWSGEQVILDPAEPAQSAWDSLTAEPAGIETVSWDEIVTAVANFSAALQVTGHLPDWIAVREIEQFARLVLHAPNQVAPPGSEHEAGPPPAATAAPAAGPDSITSKLSPATTLPELNFTEPQHADPSGDPGGPAIAPAAAQIPTVEQMTDELKKKFDSAPAVDDVVGTTSEEQVAEGSRSQADDSVTAEASDEDETADRADDLDQDETTDEDDALDQDDDLNQDEPSDEDDAADEGHEDTDSSTGTGGRHRRSDDSSDGPAAKDKTDTSDASSSSSDRNSGDGDD